MGRRWTGGALAWLALSACGEPPAGEDTCGNGVADAGELCLEAPGVLASPAPLIDGVLADLNRDGRPELVAGDAAGQLVIFPGSAAGGFLEARPPVASGAAEEIAVARRVLVEDVDQNGVPDVIVALQEQDAAGSLRGEVALFFGNGDGSFQAPRVSPLGGAPSQVVLVDVNGDGVLELLALTPNAVETRRLDPTGFFLDPRVQPIDSPEPRDFLLLDLNEDSNADLLVADALRGVSRFFGDAQANFSPGGETVLAASFALVAEDLSGDGRDDILSASLGNGVVELGRGVGTTGDLELFVSSFVGDDARSLLVSDLNQNGQLDLLSVGGGVVGIASGQGGGLLAEPVLLWGGVGLFDVIVADVTLDLIPDVITLHGLGASVLPGRAGLFPAGAGFLLGRERPKALALGDLDGDGDTDAAASTNQGIAILRNEEGALTVGDTLPLEPTPISLAAVDLDSDGDLDLVALDPAGPVGSGRFARNEGGLFPANEVVPLSGFPAGATEVLAGALDEDAGADLLVLGEAPTLFPGDGAGGLGAPILLGVGAAARGQVVDLDGDGALDILLEQGASARVLFGPDRARTASVDFSGPVVALLSADLDGDGDLDLAAARTTGQVEISLVEAGAPGPVLGLEAGLSLTGLGALDLDADGRAELLAVGEARTLAFSLAEKTLVAYGSGVLPLGGVDGVLVSAVLRGTDASLLVLTRAAGLLVVNQRR